MPTINRFADLHDDITAWRHDIHMHPELQFDVHRTAGIVAEKLTAWGCDEVVTGIGQTGVVGIIKGRQTGSGKVVGLRADMDALPMQEARDIPHKSTVAGKMHACGHDGHTAMLLGAAQYLAETRNFDGTVAVVFQPAEEGGGGGREMVNDGMMERFGVQEVYGMHNMPGLPVGQFALRPGPMMAAADLFEIFVEGKGSHAARPHDSVDPTLATAQILQALQTIVSRNIDPIESAVVSVTAFHTEGDAFNVIPQQVRMRGTVRTYLPAVQDTVEARMSEIVENIARGMGVTGRLDYMRNYPATVNEAASTSFAADVAEEVAGNGRVDRDTPPLMGAEDFSFMLNERPGAMIFIGNGDTASVHHQDYDFNDEIIPLGCSYWARLVETAMPVKTA